MGLSFQRHLRLTETIFVRGQTIFSKLWRRRKRRHPMEYEAEERPRRVPSPALIRWPGEQSRGRWDGKRSGRPGRHPAPTFLSFQPSASSKEGAHDGPTPSGAAGNNLSTSGKFLPIHGKQAGKGAFSPSTAAQFFFTPFPLPPRECSIPIG